MWAGYPAAREEGAIERWTDSVFVGRDKVSVVTEKLMHLACFTNWWSTPSIGSEHGHFGRC